MLWTTWNRKTLLARAVANRTDACFIRVIGSELVQKYVGEGARLVRELFQMARSKKACLIFFDEVDAIGGARFDDGQGGDNEVQRTMLEIVNQLDGFDARGNIKVLMATNRPDTLDPALLRPGRLDRKVEFAFLTWNHEPRYFAFTRDLWQLSGTSVTNFFPVCVQTLPGPKSTQYARKRVCLPSAQRRKTVGEKDFLDAIAKVIKGYQKFSSTAKYMVRNDTSLFPSFASNSCSVSKALVLLGVTLAFAIQLNVPSSVSFPLLKRVDYTHLD